MRYANSATALRNIYIQDSQVMLILDYSKTRRQLGTACPHVKFLPAIAGKLLVTYLVRILPFVQYLYHKKSTTPPASLSNFIFVSLRDDTPDSTTSLTNTMEVHSKPVFYWAVGTAAWRQIAIAWTRKMLCEEENNIRFSSIDTGDSNQEADNNEESLSDIQAGHTT